MKQKLNLLLIVFGISMIFLSCNDDDPEIPGKITKEQISGVVQKGPFNVGTSITLSELNEDLSPTGKQFNSQITANDGLFEYNNIELASPFVTLKADGFYFNELKGENSAAQLTLYALSDVTDQSTLNVNVLTHLEKPRVEYLISQGSTFTDAKAEALADVLNIFNISKSDILSSEQLNITNAGEDNAILLAVSAILQGFRTEAELQEILNIIANDLKEDGTLDNVDAQGLLAGHSLFLSGSKIRQNLEDKYGSLGGSYQIPTFESFITQFNENTTFTPVALINYPETSDYGLNILNKTNTQFTGMPMSTGNYSLIAETVDGLSLKIELKLVETDSEIPGHWYYSPDSKINWNVSDYNFEENSQTYTVIEPGTLSKLKIGFPPTGNSTIQINFYEGGNEITHSKIIEVETEE